MKIKEISKFLFIGIAMFLVIFFVSNKSNKIDKPLNSALKTNILSMEIKEKDGVDFITGELEVTNLSNEKHNIPTNLNVYQYIDSKDDYVRFDGNMEDHLICNNLNFLKKFGFDTDKINFKIKPGKTKKYQFEAKVYETQNLDWLSGENFKFDSNRKTKFMITNNDGEWGDTTAVETILSEKDMKSILTEKTVNPDYTDNEQYTSDLNEMNKITNNINIIANILISFAIVLIVIGTVLIISKRKRLGIILILICILLFIVGSYLKTELGY